MQEYIIHIDFLDRLGLGYEIFEIFKNHSINLIGTEAEQNQGMIIKFQCGDKAKFNQLINQLGQVRGIISVKLQDQMPYEQREYELRTILNSIDEGIIAFNNHAEITHINELAGQILHLSRQEAIGKKNDDFYRMGLPIMEILKTGHSYSLKEVKVKSNKKVLHFLSSGMPITNDNGQVIGAVVTIKDYRQVEEIISKVDQKRYLTAFDDIIHQSAKMRKIVDTARMVAKGCSTVLLRGESGTGKELFAKAMHLESDRSNGQFIAINCAALPDTLLESELFGYEDGAFTGAAKGGKKGLFEQADGGTLFLDEIGEISPQLQVRLLRVLQENAVRRISGSSEIPVDVRVIAATHCNLEEMIEKGEFREDLYYRLNVIPLMIPSLRERPEDVPLIAVYLIRKICAKLKKAEMRLSKDGVEFLMLQPWPGNVRQLENTLERVINMVDIKELRPAHFYACTDLALSQGNVNTEEELQIKIALGEECPTLKEMVSEVEKQILIRVLKNHPSSRKAGKVLGVSNTTILNKINAFGIMGK
ncbi:MAG: sigma 54-interacting transcriptional regulator [Firmicutes bacterium]|nr:sigma 54-interacting transcriptional regulator [Bacillota bacterium]